LHAPTECLTPISCNRSPPSPLSQRPPCPGTATAKTEPDLRGPVCVKLTTSERSSFLSERNALTQSVSLQSALPSSLLLTASVRCLLPWPQARGVSRLLHTWQRGTGAVNSKALGLHTWQRARGVSRTVREPLLLLPALHLRLRNVLLVARESLVDAVVDVFKELLLGFPPGPQEGEF